MIGKKAVATGGGNMVTDRVCIVACDGVDIMSTHCCICDETFVEDHEAAEVEYEGAKPYPPINFAENTVDLEGCAI